MTRPTDSEWKVLSVLWAGEAQPLGQIYQSLQAQTQWSRTTVHTYLTRMEKKGLVSTDDHSPKRYFATQSQEDLAQAEREALLVRHGSAGRLVASFVQDGALSQAERDDLRCLLDQMEV